LAVKFPGISPKIINPSLDPLRRPWLGRWELGGELD
jgi:hypothetical protein